MQPVIPDRMIRGGLEVAALAAAGIVALSGAAEAATDTALLPRNLSPWNMFINADIVVQAVMIGLAFASLVTWTIWLAKTIEVRRKTATAKRRLSLLETDTVLALFGTVWGIMNSFIGISEAHTTNLAVVAPGIAEALLATALGLVAAIPAVVIYNHLTRTISAHRALLGDASALVLLLISREGDRGSFRIARAAE